MTVTGRHYLFADDGLHRLSKRVLEGLINGTDALPQYAGTRQRTAEVMLNNEDWNDWMWNFDFDPDVGADDDPEGDHVYERRADLGAHRKAGGL